MRGAAIAGILFLFLVAWVDVASPAGGAHGPARVESGNRSGDLSEKLAEEDFQPVYSCCDISYMDVFKARQLQYARTPEFAEAVRLVASGESRYSPREIPSAWGVFAAELIRHQSSRALETSGVSLPETHHRADPANAGLRLLKDKESLIPVLLYLGSLEYRSRPGHGGISPIFPGIVRTAAVEIDGRISEKRKMAVVFARRAAAIRDRIAAAERAGAGDCSTLEVSRAKSELDRAWRDALGVRSTLKETELVFARVENVADRLLDGCVPRPFDQSRVPGTSQEQK